ncbi:hypothetical protein ACJJIE_03685 [Microbulbifer sp. TRSA001]|uniref:hypothetical protein n=1 Tax=Microbulbifer sp. TRSA001 TaxID=3243381 RepID=UPI00403A1A81
MNEEWQGGYPKLNTWVEVLIVDFMGSYTIKAMRKPYKKPPHKNMKKGCWRWIGEDGQRLDRKQWPSKWRPISN